jgi:RHH-type transcriptional regulator, rel operon repressor / antitoxin RelB
MKSRLDRLARATQRSKAWLAQRAIEDYLAIQTWQVEEIRKGLAEADAGDFATPAEVEATFAKWTKDPVAARGAGKSRSGRRVHRQG